MQKANKEHWKQDRDKAVSKAVAKTQQKTADAISDNAAIAQRIKAKLLRKVGSHAKGSTVTVTRDFQKRWVMTDGTIVKEKSYMDLTKQITDENHTTCLMVTHNLKQAVSIGNRTLMMDGGRIIFDVEGEARAKLTVPDLLVLFREAAGRNLDNDRMMLS